MINYQWLEQKIQDGECADLDFKLEWHQDSSKLRHDIVCLSNSPSKNDKYLVIGISDDKQVVGVKEPRVGVADLYVLLTDYMDAVPTLNLTDIHIEDTIVQVLTIRIDPFFRPYVLKKDVQKGGAKLRQGVVYSRTGDKNTAYNESAPLNIVEYLWKQRFALDILPEEKIYLYLADHLNWKHVDDSDEYIYMPDPDYSFKYMYDEKELTNIKEIGDLQWLNKYCNSHCPVYRDEISLMYRGRFFTNDRYIVFTSDNCRNELVYPHDIAIKNLREVKISLGDFYHYYIRGSNKDAANYNITLIINSTKDISIDRTASTKACDIYNSHQEAYDYLKSNGIELFTYIV